MKTFKITIDFKKKNISVINDVTEKGVKLVEDYTNQRQI